MMVPQPEKRPEAFLSASHFQEALRHYRSRKRPRKGRKRFSSFRGGTTSARSWDICRDGPFANGLKRVVSRSYSNHHRNSRRSGIMHPSREIQRSVCILLRILKVRIFQVPQVPTGFALGPYEGTLVSSQPRPSF